MDAAVCLREQTAAFCVLRWDQVPFLLAAAATPGPEDDFRAEFVRDLLRFFMDCDMDGTDLRCFHPEIDKALDELGVGDG